MHLAPMSKKLIPILVITLAFALLGLIGVQAYWMREAFKMKSDEFDRSVSEALKSTNYALEAREASRLLANSFDQRLLVRQIDSLAGPVFYTYDTIESLVVAKETPKKSKQSFARRYPTIFQQNSIEIDPISRAQLDCLRTQKEKAMQQMGSQHTRTTSRWTNQLEEYHSQEALKQMQHSRQFYTISIDIDSVFELWADSLQFPTNAEHIFFFNGGSEQRLKNQAKNDQVIFNYGENEFAPVLKKPRTVVAQAPVARPNQEVKKRIVQKKLSIDSLLNKVAFDYISPKQPIEKRITEHEFDSILWSNLQQQGINVDFQFQVIREQTDSIQFIYGDKLLKSDYYEARLFPNDMFNLNERLLVHFPQPTSFLLGNLLGMLLVSFALVIVLFVIFFVTISVLLKQKKLSDMKSDFINNMTHEFKTPLATINLAADALANAKVQHNLELTSKYLGIIKTENKRMNTHVEQVLQTAQLERQELKLNLQKIDLRYLLEHALELMEMQYDNRQAKLSLDCDHTECYIDCDETHLLNVFTNLLDNALKYAKNDPEVTITGKIVGKKAIIQVKDNGIGMTKETRQRIFEKFYRLPTGNVHNIKGFGLGLSYVKAIIEAHKGSINVESELELGSTFTVTLPLSSN